MRALLIFLVLLASTPSAIAQSSIDPNQFIDKKVLRNADVNQLWRTLGISGQIRETLANGAKDAGGTFNCAEDNRCEAQRIGLSWPLVGDGGEDSIVRIAPTYLDSNFRRFLVFHREEGAAWRLVDYLDLTEWDYSQPEISVVNSGGKRWLVVKAHPHCGTGCSLIHADWFELNNGKLRMVLTLPLSGHYGNENPGREFETRFVRARQSAGRESLEFVYHVEFGPGFGSSTDADLWGEEKINRFSRPTGQGEFKFDAKNSEASEAFVMKIFNSLDVELPQLFEFVQDHLLEIARGPNDRRRDWLKEVLEQNPDLPQLARVREAFKTAQ